MTDRRELTHEEMRERVAAVEQAEDYARAQPEGEDYPIMLPKGKYHVVSIPPDGAPSFTRYLFRNDEGKLSWTIWRGKPLLGGTASACETLAEAVQLAVQAKCDNQLGAQEGSTISLLFVPD